MGHQYHFRMSSIDKETVRERCEERGFEDMAEYFRHLIREDIYGGDPNV